MQFLPLPKSKLEVQRIVNDKLQANKKTTENSPPRMRRSEYKKKLSDDELLESYWEGKEVRRNNQGEEIIDTKHITWYLSMKCGIKKDEAKKAIAIIAEHMCDELTIYDYYNIRGLGKIYKIKTKPYSTYSVFSKGDILHPSHIRLYFRASETFKCKLRGEETAYKKRLMTDVGMQQIERNYQLLKEKREKYGNTYQPVKQRGTKLQPKSLLDNIK